MNTLVTSVLGAIAVVVALASSARTEGLPDVLGIQLGMPAREAHAKLQAALPKYKIQVGSINLPTIDKPVILSFSSGTHNVPEGMEGDEVIVDVTLPPNKQVVWRVYRVHFFPDKGILKTTLLASLREKYGKETRAENQQGKPTTDDTHITRMLWLMDEQGRPTPPPPLNGMVDPISSCPARVANSQIVETPAPNYGNKDLAWCMSSYTAVNVEFTPSPAVPELYTQL